MAFKMNSPKEGAVGEQQHTILMLKDGRLDAIENGVTSTKTSTLRKVHSQEDPDASDG
jgi:hypothetical protein